ncbi:flap endonuclease-1 [Candidatus Micrarchaeota archaeon]|nr:flap endonuclease-1 [Candidatus Micrarchaeota archaeon]
MGVDFGDVLEKKELSFSEIKGKVAVDAFNSIYQFLTIIRQRDGTPLMDSQGRITSHLSGLFYRTCNLLEKGIKPIYVFDGEPHELKRKTILERKERKEEAMELYKKAREEGREEEMMKYAQRTAKLSEEQVAESKELLGYMGAPWIQAKSEGEAQCAYMCKKGLVNAAASQDFDSLLFGAPKLIRNLTVAGRRKLPKREMYVEVLPEEYDLQENLKRLGITQQKLVWMGILVGTDFNEGIFGIGPKKALKLIQQFNSFEDIQYAIKQKMEWETLENIFLKPETVEINKEELEFKRPQRDKITKFMCSEHDFSHERVESALEKAFKEPLESEQSSLTKWF